MFTFKDDGNCDGDNGDVTLQEAPRGDAPRSRNAPAYAAAVARLFTQPGVSSISEPLRP